MAKSDFNFFCKIRVRWAEVDKQGIVFNAHYLGYFDIGVTDYYRAIGHPYLGPFPQTGTDLYLKSAKVEYHASAGFDDLIDLGVRVSRIGNSSFEFRCEIYETDNLLTTGDLVYVNADPNTFSPSTLPKFLQDAFTKFEKLPPQKKSTNR